MNLPNRLNAWASDALDSTTTAPSANADNISRVFMGSAPTRRNSKYLQNLGARMPGVEP
jgi:hypothetical protein